MMLQRPHITTWPTRIAQYIFLRGGWLLLYLVDIGIDGVPGIWQLAGSTAVSITCHGGVGVCVWLDKPRYIPVVAVYLVRASNTVLKKHMPNTSR